MKMWKFCLLWVSLGALGSWNVAAVVWPVVQLRLRSARLAQYDADLYAKYQPNFQPESVVCFFSKAMQNGDPVGYFRIPTCNPKPLSLSRELTPMITLGDDGFFRIADAEALQAVYETAGIIIGSVECEGETAARVRLVRVAEPWQFIAISSDQISARLHESTRATSYTSIVQVLALHWNEIERRVPVNRQARRTIDENMIAILDNKSCDVSDEIRDIVVGAIELARMKGAKTSEQIRSNALSAVADAGIRRITELQRYFEDLNNFQNDFHEAQYKAPDDRVRVAILLHMKLQAKYPPRDFVSITPHQVLTALRNWPE